jgi:hypothetical protein
MANLIFILVEKCIGRGASNDLVVIRKFNPMLVTRIDTTLL